MSIQTAIERILPAIRLLRCPLCSLPFRFSDQGSLICGRNHCFDLSSRASVNFVPNQRQTRYEKPLFESRARIFHDGFYHGVEEAIYHIVSEWVARSPALLDAGCGEGYFLRKVDCALRQRGVAPLSFGIDLSKDAIALAAKHAPLPCFFVADLANLPFCDHSFDAVLNILSPANYGEFARVLKPSGIVIKAIPGGEYLREIRAAIGQRPHSGAEVARHFSIHNELLATHHCRATLPVADGQRADFIAMTPLTFGRDTRGDGWGIYRRSP